LTQKPHSLRRPVIFRRDLPEKLVIAFRAAEFWISPADFIKPGTVDAAGIQGAAVRTLELIHPA
jgi:hypothetical protein